MTTKTIRIKEATYNELCKHGKFGDTMDDVINNILGKLSKKRKQNK